MPSRSTRAALAACVAAVVASGCSRSTPLGADLVVTHANVWTGDPLRPRAEAVAVIGDRIVDVGAADEIERWRGPSTTVVDAAGRLVVPGFDDAHVHLVDGGRRLDDVDLSDADSKVEFARRIAERARAKPGEWIVGGAWDDRRWGPPELPTRHLIDDRTNGTPVFVTRYDGRMALANSAALGRAGVTERTPDPPGGLIVRDENGFPTGALQDAAMQLVARAVPKVTPEQRRRAAKRALELAASLGVTSVQDMNPSYDDVAVYADLAGRGELTARIYAASPDADWYDEAKIGLRRAFGSPWLRLGAIHAGTSGALSAEQRTRLMAADHAGLQVCMEATPGAGMSAALDLMAELIRIDGDRDRRFRIEHAEEAGAAEAAQFAPLKVIASMDGASPHEFARFAGSSVRTAIGSDWPAASLDPMRRLAPDAAGATVGAVLAAYTSGSAFAEFQEAEKGTIARGRLADLVILSDDLFSKPPPQIQDVKVLTTIVGGRIVHQRNP
jgi:predicted amidohydrolase YtcJ